MALMKRPDMPDINKLAKPGKKREDGLSYLTAENAHRKEQGITPPAPPRRKLFGDIIQYKPRGKSNPGAGLYTAANTPSFEPENATLPWNRGTGIIRGAGAGTAAGFLNLGGLAADTGARVIDAFKTGDYDTAQKTINRIEADLARGRTYDGERLTPRDIEHLRAQLAEAKAIVEVKKPEGTMESRNKTLTTLRDSLYQGADETADYGQGQTMRAKDGLGKLGQMGVDVAQAGLQMAGDAAMGGIGATLARSVGSSAQEARQAGASFNDQLGYGVSSGLLSAATEKIANVAAPFKAAFGAGVADKAIGKLMGRLGSSKLGKLALSALSEGGEEFVEDIFQPVLQRATYDQNARFNLDEALYDAAIGAVLGGAGSVGEIMATPKAPKAENQPVRAPQQNVQTAAPVVDAPAANVAPAASQGAGVGVAENATTTRPAPDLPDIPVGDIEAVGTDIPVGAKSEGDGPSWKQKFLDESFFTNLANPRASEEMVDDEVRRFAEHAGESYEPGDTYGSFADYSWSIDRHKFGPYFELSVRNRITGESKHISGDRNQRSIASEISRAIYEDATNMLNEVRRPAPSATVSKNETVASDTPVAEDSSDVGQNPSMGAADQGFDGGFAGFQAKADNFHPINEAAAERTANEQGRAEAEIPTVNPVTGKNISKIASTIANSPLTSNEFETAEEQAIMAGRYDVMPITDQAANAKAQAAIANEGGYKPVADRFVSKVNNDVAVGKKDLAEAIAAYNQAIQNGDNKTAFELVDSIVASARSAAQMVQAMGLFNKMTPEGRLMVLRRYVERRNKTNTGKPKVTYLSDDQVKSIMDAVSQQRDDAMNIIQTLIDQFAEDNGKPRAGSLYDVMAGSKNAGEIDAKIKDTENSWINQLAKELGSSAVNTVKPQKAKQRSTFEIISSDLNKFMRQYLSPQKQQTVKRTAGDTLRDFFNNRQEYARAWNKAREDLKAKYKNDPAMLARLDEFLGGTITYNSTGSDAVMMRAMADAALAQDVNAKEKVIRGQYDADNLAAEIASDVIRESGATEEADRMAIVSAAKRFVESEYENAAESRRSSVRENGRDVTAGQEASTYFESDIKKSMRDIGVKMNEIIRQGARTKADLAANISNMLVSQYHISPDGASAIASDVVDTFSNMVDTASRKQLEQIFRDSPERTQKTVQQKFTELGNMGAFTDPAFDEKATAKIFGTEEISLDSKKAAAFLNAETEEARTTAWEAILQDLADQVPATFADKWNAWRYLAMLGNPRTHVRNIAGNAGFQPVRYAKDKIAAGLEAALSKAGVKVERTKAFRTAPGMRKAVWSDYANVAKILGGTKYDDVNSQIRDRQTIFNTKPLEKIRKKNGEFLELEDSVFKHITYADALAGYLTANGVTVEQVRSGTVPAEIMERGRTYAANEALKATYQDDNVLSRKTNEIVHTMGPVGEAIMPFKKTPANILARSLEYSPVGLAKSLTVDLAKVKNGSMDISTALDHVASGATGSALFALGAYLLSEGILTTSLGDEDDDKWAQLLGHQGYAIELPGGTSVTVDWMAPESLPFFMGAEFMDAAGENGFQAQDITTALKSMANPMLELSMLQGVNDLIDSAKFAKEKPLQAMIPSVITSYFSQAIPTLFGQLERTGEDIRMTTYADKNSQLSKDTQYALGRASSRLPGVDYNQIPFIDAWGQHQSTGGAVKRGLNNLLNPAFISRVDMDSVEKELQGLRDSTGDTSVFPDRAPRKISVSGTQVDLSADQYVKYAEKRGQDSYKMVKAGISSKAYKGMDKAQKAEYIGRLYDYADQNAKAAVSDYKVQNWVKNAKTSQKDIGVSTAEYIALYQKYGNYYLSDSDGYERTKQIVASGMTVEEYLTMRQEAKSLDGKKNGAENRLTKAEAATWLSQNGFQGKEKGKLLNIMFPPRKKN